MNREATILYLREVVDLEVAKRRLSQLYHNEQAVYKQKRSDLISSKVPEQVDEKIPFPKEPSRNNKYSVSAENMSFLLFVMFAFYLILMFIGIKFVIDFSESTYTDTQGAIYLLKIGTVCFIIFFLITILLIIYKRKKAKIQYYSDLKEHEARCKKIPLLVEERKTYNKNVVLPALEKKKQKIEEADQEWNQRSDYLRSEYSKVSSLLDSYYAMNFIPNQYRYKLSSVYYIFDWMSSTQDTLRDTLIQTKIEDGIRRIEGRLDQIVGHLEDIIYETRCVGKNVQSLICQNNSMLRHLQESSRNTAEAAQYAELASNYSKASAYFGLANYLKH